MNAQYSRYAGSGYSVAIWALPLAVIAMFAGCAAQREHVIDEELVRRRIDYIEASAKRRKVTERQLMALMKQKQNDFLSGRTNDPPTFDVLILSGGGDFGAFGAGFLHGWSTVTDPRWKKPAFDLVTGVSTGALLAPFAFLGDRESLERAVVLYSEPSTDWISLRGLFFFLPGNRSLMRIDGLKRDIKAEFSEPVIRRIVEESDRGRLLAIGTTNLDFGMQRIWDMGVQGRAALESGSNDRFVDILLASSAIPGAFPAIEIDGNLYADGAITANILYNASAASSEGFAASWQREFPDQPVPRARFWVIINNQLIAPPAITPPTWTGVMGASISTAIRSATNTSLNHLQVQIQLLEALGIAKADFHYVAIPEEWRAPVRGAFQAETMSNLADLGKKMGADPASWRIGAEPIFTTSDTLPVLGNEAP